MLVFISAKKEISPRIWSAHNKVWRDNQLWHLVARGGHMTPFIASRCNVMFMAETYSLAPLVSSDLALELERSPISEKDNYPSEIRTWRPPNAGPVPNLGVFVVIASV